MHRPVDNLNGSDYAMLQAGKVNIINYYKTKVLQVLDFITRTLGVCSSDEQGTLKTITQADRGEGARVDAHPLPMYMPPNNSFSLPFSIPRSPFIDEDLGVALEELEAALFSPPCVPSSGGPGGVSLKR